MKQVVMGGLVGGVVFFVYLWISWIALPFHTMAFTEVENTKPIADAMKAEGYETGLYTVPSMTEWEANEEDFVARHEAGPVIPFLVYYTDGMSMMSPMMYIKGIITTLVAAFLVALMMKLALPNLNGYMHRVLVATAFGVFAAVVGPLTLGNWMMFPAGYVWAEVLDQVLGWTLVGLVMAPVIKPSVA